MEYLSTGPRELARRVNRQTVRRRLATIHRALAKAEAELGLLGWQQADYDAETQRQVQEIQDVEKEQARLTNESAVLAGDIRQIQAERQAAQKSYEERLKQLDADLRKVREPCEAAERRLAEKRKSEPNFVQRIPDLDRELRETQKMYAELIQQTPQTSQVRQDLARLRERIVEIPNEKSDLRTQHLRTVSEIRALEEALERDNAVVAEAAEKVRVLKEAWTEQEKELAARIETMEAAKKSLETESEALEGSKANPYQRIGKVLADNNIAPLNQPEALEKVKRLRFEVGERLQIILESEARSAKEDPKIVKASFALWGVICFVFLFILVAALH